MLISSYIQRKLPTMIIYKYFRQDNTTAALSGCRNAQGELMRLQALVRLPYSFSLKTQSGALFENILHIPIRASVVAMALQQMVLIPEG